MIMMKMMAPKSRSLSWCGSVVVALAALSWCGCATTAAAAAAATTARQMGPLVCNVAPLPDWDRKTITRAGGIYVVDLNADGRLAAVVADNIELPAVWAGKVLTLTRFGIMNYQPPRPVAADAIAHLKPSQEKTQAILKALQALRTMGAGVMVGDLGGGWFGPVGVPRPTENHDAAYLLKLAEGPADVLYDPPPIGPACYRYPSDRPQPPRYSVGATTTCGGSYSLRNNVYLPLFVAPPQQEQAASTGTKTNQQRCAFPVSQSSAAADEAGTPPPAAKIFGNQKFLVDDQDVEMVDASAGSTGFQIQGEPRNMADASGSEQGRPDSRPLVPVGGWEACLTRRDAGRFGAVAVGSGRTSSAGVGGPTSFLRREVVGQEMLEEAETTVGGNSGDIRERPRWNFFSAGAWWWW